MEAQTFFGVAAPIYPTHKPLSTQRFVGIVVTNYQQFSPISGPPPWSSISLLLVRESRLCCACLVGAILLCAYLMEHEGFEPSCRALPNAGVNTRSDLLCPRKEGGTTRYPSRFHHLKRVFTTLTLEYLAKALSVPNFHLVADPRIELD